MFQTAGRETFEDSAWGAYAHVLGRRRFLLQLALQAAELAFVAEQLFFKPTDHHCGLLQLFFQQCIQSELTFKLPLKLSDFFA